jgi:enoyl-[acyl-carrier protein] reductase I
MFETGGPIVDLEGRIGLVIGIANAQSIAAGCARAFAAAGARLAVTYLSEKARPFVEAVTAHLPCDLLAPCDVREAGSLEAVFAAVREKFGRLDFVLHSIAFAPAADLHGRLTDSSAAGFATAIDISAHSFVRCARLAEPLMPAGGALLSVSFFGAERVVAHYGLMGPVKAALESATRYLAAELGPQRISVNAISPGPLRTRAASGIADFDALLDDAAAHAPEHQLVTIEDVGALAAFLASDAARMITGTVIPVDGGRHAVA